MGCTSFHQGIRYPLPVGKDHGTDGSSDPTAARPGRVGIEGSAFLQVPMDTQVVYWL